MRTISNKILFGALLLIILVGTFGYHAIEGWTLFDGLYMTVITITTVGYMELHQLSDAGRWFTMLLLFTGFGIAFLALSNLSAAFLRGELQQHFGRRRMQNEIDRMKDHYILAGFGRMGQVIATELAEHEIEFVIIDQQEPKSPDAPIFKFNHLIGDVLDETILKRAGIERARGFVSVVSNDADNAFAVMTAKGLNSKLHIVSRAISPSSVPKLRMAGAERVVAPYLLGGTRIAQAVVHPTTVDFVEVLEDSSIKDIEMVDVVIHSKSKLVGAQLNSETFRDSGVLVVGIKTAQGQFNFQPDRNTALQPNDHLVVVGPGERVERLLKLAEESAK